jgi:hypothetical protein
MNGPLLNTPYDEQLEMWREIDFSVVRPEEISFVREYKHSPPEGVSFKILGELSVKDNWQDKSLIQCNICNRKKKFKLEGYVTTFDDGWWYVVGPDCGGENFVNRFASEKRIYDKMILTQIADDRINIFIQTHQDNIKKNTRAKTIIESAFKLRASVKKGQPELFSKLVTAIKTGSNLTYADWSDTEFSYISRQFHTLRVPQIFAGHFTLIEDHKNLMQEFQSRFEFTFNDEVFSCNVTNDVEMRKFSDLIARWGRHLENTEKLRERMEANLMFDLNKIGEWASLTGILDYNPITIISNTSVEISKHDLTAKKGEPVDLTAVFNQ